MNRGTVSEGDDIMGTHSDFLFATPSFIEGWARIWDFTDALNMYNESLSPEQADEIAAWIDWSAVGTALREGMGVFEEQERVSASAA